MIRYDFYSGEIHRNRRLVSKNGKFGFIDGYKKEVIPPIYDYAIGFYYGNSVVGFGGKYGLIDINGNALIPIIYDKVLRQYSNEFIVKLNDKFTIVDANNKQLIPEYYDEIRPNNFYRYIVKKNNKYGAIDSSGKLLIPIMYEDLSNNADETLWYVTLNGHHGIIDENNNFILLPIYDKIIAKNYNYYIAFISKDGKWGFSAKNGDIFIPASYKSIQISHKDKLKASSFNDKFGIVNIEGNIIVPFEYDSLDVYFSEDTNIEVYIASKEGKYGVLDSTGKIIVNFIYDCIDTDFVNNYGSIKVRIGNKVSLISHTGESLTKQKYDQISYLNYASNLILVKKDKLIGCIDVNGTEILPPNFNNIEIDSNGFLIVKKDNKYGLYTWAGKQITKTIYSDIKLRDFGRYAEVRICSKELQIFDGYLYFD